MKLKLLAIATLLLISLKSFSQVSQGNVFAGGSFIIQNNKYTDNHKSTTFGISPRVGYFISNNFSVGLSIGYNHYTDKTTLSNVLGTYDHKYKNGTFNIGPFARYYKSLGSDKFFLFVEGQLSFAHNTVKNEDKYASSSSDMNSIGVGFTPGFIFFPTPKFGFEANFGSLSLSHYLEGSKSTTTGLNLNTNSLAFGFNYYFN